MIDILLYSHHLPAWYCIDIVRRNSVLVTHGSKRVKVHLTKTSYGSPFKPRSWSLFFSKLSFELQDLKMFTWAYNSRCVLFFLTVVVMKRWKKPTSHNRNQNKTAKKGKKTDRTCIIICHLHEIGGLIATFSLSFTHPFINSFNSSS